MERNLTEITKIKSPFRVNCIFHFIFKNFNALVGVILKLLCTFRQPHRNKIHLCKIVSEFHIYFFFFSSKSIRSLFNSDFFFVFGSQQKPILFQILKVQNTSASSSATQPVYIENLNKSSEANETVISKIVSANKMDKTE